MDVGAVCGIAQIDSDGVSYPHAHERTGHLVIKSPIFVGTAIRETALDLGRFQIKC
jgi:hypothetical protein